METTIAFKIKGYFHFFPRSILFADGRPILSNRESLHDRFREETVSKTAQIGRMTGTLIIKIQPSNSGIRFKSPVSDFKSRFQFPLLVKYRKELFKPKRNLGSNGGGIDRSSIWNGCLGVDFYP